VDAASQYSKSDWAEYFYNIRQYCPWAYAAWQKNLIDIVHTKEILPLDEHKARVYIFNLNKRKLKKLCKSRDEGEYEWLWSVPGYGINGTPLPCLIQQSRQELTEIRNKLSQIDEDKD
jgi:hypothetical protein